MVRFDRIKIIGIVTGSLLFLGILGSIAWFSYSPANVQKIPDHYIVVLKDVDDPGAVADEMALQHGLLVLHVYKYAIKGFNAIIPEANLDEVESDPRVDYVEEDQKILALPQPPNKGLGGGGGKKEKEPAPPQIIPTGVDRINADLSATAKIDGVDERVDVDIAIIDSGIDPEHPDLNVVNHVRCTGTGANWDQNGHGTHVAGTAAAIDNEEGVVGVAPGARLWGVKVLDENGSGTLGCLIWSVDYVTVRADEIEVANMSLGCECTSNALDTAIANSVGAGVVYVVSAANESDDASSFRPANHHDVITVSAIADFDGQGGELTDKTVSLGDCVEDKDDSFACFSNFGSSIELAAPGVKILSTSLEGGYSTKSGTSMASPHVAGAAALYLSNHPSALPAAVRDALIVAATQQSDPDGFTGDPDEFPEPLVNVEGV